MENSSRTGKAYYVEIWTEILAEFFHWSRDQVIAWTIITGIAEFLDDPNDIFYHQNPIYWITTLLVPETLKIKLAGIELVNLQWRLFLAFKDERLYDFPKNTDWRTYKEGAEGILKEYQEIDPVILELIEKLKDKNTWLCAAEELATVGEPATLPLVKLLREPSCSNFAFHALTQMEIDATNAFFEALKQDSNEARMWGITGLSYLINDRATQGLLLSLTDRNTFNRKLAADAIKKRKEHVKVIDLQRLEANITSEQVRREIHRLVMIIKQA